MKKLFFLLLALLLVSTLQAADNKNKSKLAHDMRTMLSAIEGIQRAGFYNNIEGMKDGVARLKTGLASLESEDASKYLPDEEAYANKFAQKRASMIRMYADDIVLSLESKNMDDALESYTQILKQCSSCHLRIRKW